MAKKRAFGNRIRGKAYVLRRGVYALIRGADGTVAIVETPEGNFLVGGGAARGESPRAALGREAREECGCRLMIGSRVGIVDEFLFAKKERTYFQKRCTFFIASILEQIRNSAREADHRLKWMSFEEAVRGLFHESHRWAVRHAFNPNRRGQER